MRSQLRARRNLYIIDLLCALSRALMVISIMFCAPNCALVVIDIILYMRSQLRARGNLHALSVARSW